MAGAAGARGNHGIPGQIDIARSNHDIAAKSASATAAAGNLRPISQCEAGGVNIDPPRMARTTGAGNDSGASGKMRFFRGLNRNIATRGAPQSATVDDRAPPSGGAV